MKITLQLKPYTAVFISTLLEMYHKSNVVRGSALDLMMREVKKELTEQIVENFTDDVQVDFFEDAEIKDLFFEINKIT